MGKGTSTPRRSRIDSSHARWLWIESIESPISLTLRASNSPFRRASSESSVVQTGVKSAGCEKSRIHLPPCHSDNVRGPWVVVAVAAQTEVIDVIAAALSDRTRVLAFTDVSANTGLRMPTAELCRIGRDRGLYVHVDGAQTCGALQRNLRELGCDSYSASGQKWLLGPREIGILYLRSERQDAMWPGVVGVGWGTAAKSTATGARKFETLGQRNDAATAGLAAALDFHEHIGPARVEARVRELAGRLHDGLLANGFELVTPRPPELRHGVIIAKAEAIVGQRWHQRLYVGHNVIGSPTGGLRLSPNLYNTLADVDRAVKALVAVRSEA